MSSLILHLTDLHLGPGAGDTPLDDYKSEILGLSERRTRGSALHITLEKLGASLINSNRSLDAIVASGDFTYQGQSKGFAEFDGLLAKLGSARPANAQIVVLPGNHDVAWRTKPGTNPRYKGFVNRLLQEGYVCPLLEGVDVSSHPQCLASVKNDWVVVPLNSANWCGSLEPTGLSERAWAELVAHLDLKQRAKLERLRLFDVARVGAEQLRSLEAQLSDAPPTAFRIVSLHHQLGPVSVTEEFKPYESITNLGWLRRALADRKVDLVLHGHKHQGQVAIDYVATSGGDIHPIRILSGSTVGGAEAEADVARLIEIDSSDSDRHVKVFRIGAAREGLDLQQSCIAEWRTWAFPNASAVSMPEISRIAGKSVHSVYRRLMDSLGNSSAEIYNLVCQVEAPADQSLPDGYPEIPAAASAAERQEWFAEIVRWWQRKRERARPPEDRSFTHGDRIRAFGGAEGKAVDQLARVVNALLAKDNGKAYMTLVDPRHDAVDLPGSRLPSFTAAQFIRRTHGQAEFLDCVAYFRKQELRHWWPVNVAELHDLQRVICARVTTANRPVSPGMVTTYAAVAVVGSGLPRVFVPLIDRLYDESPDDLWDLGYTLTRGLETGGHAELHQVVADLRPGTYDPDGVPVALAGLKSLADQVRHFGRHYGGLDSVARLLEGIYDANVAYSGRPRDPHAFQVWETKVRANVEELEQQLSNRDANGE